MDLLKKDEFIRDVLNEAASFWNTRLHHQCLTGNFGIFQNRYSEEQPGRAISLSFLYSSSVNLLGWNMNY